MKPFSQYLTESKKTYEFKIKVAGELDEHYNSLLKTAMERFSVVKMSKGKRTPIQETPLDFPQLKNTQVTVFEVEVNYPTTPEVLENYLAQVCGYPLSNFKVITANDASELYREEVKNKDEATAVLEDEELESDSAQDVVGQSRVMSLLKDLDKVNAERKAATVKTEAKPGKEMSDPEFEAPKDGTVSPIGSKAVKGK